MTVIRPNSISGINSITANGGDINLFRADGTKADIPIVNNITAGVVTATKFVGQIDATSATFSGNATVTGNLGVGGVLTYEDVTNVDSVGVITARNGLQVINGSVGIGTTNSGAKLEIHSNTIPRINSVYQGSKHFGMSVGGLGGGLVITDGHFMTINHQPYADRGTDNNLTERFRISASGLNVTGVGTFSGGVTVGYDTTYSPIQQAANTYFYTRADLATSVSGSNIQNLATGSIKISETIPISNMTRQSDAGAHSFYNSSSTSGSVSRNMTAANPFAPKSYGLTMGTLFYSHNSGNNGSGVIHYGGNASTQHFYVRYKYNGDSILVGEDTGGSDVWTVAYQNDLMSDSNWYFLVVAIERNGTLLTSLNGAPLTPIRLSGTAPAPTDAVFGLAGDPYADNDSRHRYATAFWHRGVMSNELIAQEYDWLKTIWTGASLP
tara:strand:- start:1847 stop:3163 length:1317 start_codon:yes stop_codon:yes gene_type:complete